MHRRALILGYHNVTPTPYFSSAGSSATDGFRRQMKALRATTTLISLAEVVRLLSEHRPLPPRATVVTFDDGYRDNRFVAAPILRDLDIPATFFLVPQFLSNQKAPWWERLAWTVQRRRSTGPVLYHTVPIPAAAAGPAAALRPLVEHMKTLSEAARQQAVQEVVDVLDPAGVEPRQLMMDWADAKHLAAMGFDIGSHSARHAILANELPGSQLADLRSARILLETHLGRAVDLLAYPNGTAADFDDSTVEAARQSGYRGAVTTIDGWNDSATDLFALRRFVMYPERGAVGFGVTGRHIAREMGAAWGSTRGRRRPVQTRTAGADPSSSAAS